MAIKQIEEEVKVPITTTTKGGAGIPFTGNPAIVTPAIFNPNDPTSAIMQQQISGAPTGVSTIHTNTVPLTGVVANAQVGTVPANNLSLPPSPEQTALNNPNAPPVQTPTNNLTLPEAPVQTALNNPNAPPEQVKAMH